MVPAPVRPWGAAGVVSEGCASRGWAIDTSGHPALDTSKRADVRTVSLQRGWKDFQFLHCLVELPIVTEQQNVHVSSLVYRLGIAQLLQGEMLLVMGNEPGEFLFPVDAD